MYVFATKKPHADSRCHKNGKICLNHSANSAEMCFRSKNMFDEK